MEKDFNLQESEEFYTELIARLKNLEKEIKPKNEKEAKNETPPKPDKKPHSKGK